MTALLALALAVAPGCPRALAAAAALPDADLAARAGALLRALDDAGAGPTGALALAAAALEPAGSAGAAGAFRGALARHCALAAAPRAAEASAADRAALAEVLARPELSQPRLDPSAIRRALGRLWGWLVDLLGTEEAERYASLGRALVLAVSAAALALAVAALRRRRVAGPAGEGRARAALHAAGAPEPGAAPAEEALRRGDAREAVRLALLAALGALERAGRVPRGRALTNEEVVRLVAPTSNLAAELRPLARAFDRAIYGGLAVAPEDARDAVDRARRVVAAAGGEA